MSRKRSASCFVGLASADRRRQAGSSAVGRARARQVLRRLDETLGGGRGRGRGRGSSSSVLWVRRVSTSERVIDGESGVVRAANCGGVRRGVFA